MERKYNKPAIKEVICEIKFDYNDFDIALPGQFFEKVKDEFPEKKNISYIGIGINNVRQDLVKEPQIPKFQTWKKDKTALLQIGPGIVTVNQQAYTGWENFVPMLSKALSSYVDCAKPKIVTEIGIRYINIFTIPEATANLSEYFNFGLQLPANIIDLAQFNFQFSHKINSASKEELLANITFATIPISPDEEGGKLLLDISCTYSEHIVSIDSKKIIDICSEAHENISDIFEGFLTEKTRELMELKG